MRQNSHLYSDYSHRFPQQQGFEYIMASPLIGDPRFEELLRQALATGMPLTQAQLDQEFGGVGFNEGIRYSEPPRDPKVVIADSPPYREYTQRFPPEKGFEFVIPLPLIGNRGLERLLREALANGEPLTQARIKAALGFSNFDEGRGD